MQSASFNLKSAQFNLNITGNDVKLGRGLIVSMPTSIFISKFQSQAKCFSWKLHFEVSAFYCLPIFAVLYFKIWQKTPDFVKFSPDFVMTSC